MTTIGSLCSGYGGLDLAAEALLDATTAWHCEYADDPSRILAVRWPDVPNHRDLKQLAWADHPVDVLTAGYPCQPFSGAGKRLGTEDPRHLFPYIAQGVERMRPPLLLLENVRGHLTLGFDVVLAELDRIGYDARWTLLRAADVGAPHSRSRLWIAARDRQVGGWPAPSGEPTALAEDGEWVSPHGGLFGSIPAERPGTAGTMVGGLRWDSDAAVVNAGGVLLAPWHERALMPTPRTSDTNGPGRHGTGGPDLRTVVGELLPTPTTQPNTGNGHARDLGSEVRNLLPTPKATEGGPDRGEGEQRYRGAPNLAGALLPTPTSADSSGDLMLPSAVQLMPTPLSSDGGGERGSSAGFGLRDESRRIAADLSPWGPYAAAVQRWEALTRPAPSPTEPGRNGAPRLSPRFVEWMMGLPDGWVTSILGRNPSLTALGNGVVPQAAHAAFGLLLADLLASEAAA